LPLRTKSPELRFAHSSRTMPRPRSRSSASSRLKSERSFEGKWTSAAHASPARSRSTPSRLPWVSSASEQRDSRTAHSSSGSWLPAIVAGAGLAPAAPTARPESQRSTASTAKSSLPPARVCGIAPRLTRS
jgi:hypothetical protein